MIDELHVSDLALIHDATLEPAAGLTALTGETGAGKSALLGAAKLLAGDRADSSLVRQGASEAIVEARFVTAPGTGDDDGDDGELVVRRRVGADGRSRCTVDGAMSSVRSMGERVRPLLELCGQHEHQTLLDPATHASYLDAWAGEPAREALAAYRDALAAARAAQRAYDEVLAASQASAADLEVARFTIAEIERVDPTEGEADQLEAELPALEHAEELAQGVDEALSLLRRDGGAVDSLAQAAEHLGRLAEVDPALDRIAQVVASAADAAGDAAGDLRSYRDSIEFDPGVLEAHLDRLGELEGLRKRYGPRMEDVFARLEAARQVVSGVEGADERLGDARGRLDAAESALAQAARGLTKVRRDASKGFCEALGRAVADLQMDGAHFEMALDDLPREQWTAAGPQRVELLFASGAGLAPRPLAKIASGGELSRVMLALRGSVGLAEHGQTLIFDEIDAGIGGSAAVAVAERLATLARTHQVIVVTHLAQIAVHAQMQVVVSKRAGDDGIPATTLTPVAGEQRVAEIARMLSGDTSEASLSHAREMLEAAGNEVAG